MPKTMHTPGSFCWFELGTTDQNAAKTFYSGIFGWTPHDSPIGPDEVYTIFKIDGLDAAAGYTLRPDQQQQGVPPHWMPYIFTKNTDATAARAKQLGGTVVVEPFDVMDHGRMSVVQDPTGAMFCIWQPIKHAGTGVTQVHGTVVWADLSTTDQVRGAKFYSDLFGWKMVEGESMKPAAPGSYYHIVNGGTMIGGVPPAEYRAAGVPSHWLLYYQVDNCDATVTKVKSLGGRVVVPTMTMGDVRKYAVLADPQGAVFAVVQELGGSEGTGKSKPKPKKAAAKRTPAKKATKKPARKASKKPARKAAAKKARKPAKRKGKAKK
jgi:predicted enzyme related to lactoylglutathione lyase